MIFKFHIHTHGSTFIELDSGPDFCGNKKNILSQEMQISTNV